VREGGKAMEFGLRRVALLCALLTPQCTKESAPQIPGGTSVSKASPADQVLSLVSLSLPKVADLQSVDVDNLIGYKPESKAVGFGDRMVVTVTLPRNKPAKLQVRCNSSTGVETFTANLTPRHSLSTFHGLSFGGKTVTLTDYGKEFVLTGGKNVVKPQGLTTLWIGNRFVKAARLHITGLHGDGGVLSVKCSGAVVVRGGRLFQTETVVSVGGGEDLGLIVPESHLPSTIEVTQGNLGH